MVTFLFVVKKGKPDFQSDYNTDRFNQELKDHEGELYEIKRRANPVSDEMRGYTFGALIPFLQSLVPEWGDLSAEQVYEILKREFNGFVAMNPVTRKKEKYGQSVMNRSMKNKKAMEFIMRIGNWVEENYGQTLPDPSEYTNWRDSAPLKDQEYQK